MQRRAQAQYSSSGELDVFGATRYFDGLADDLAVRQPEDVMIQVKDMHHREGSCRSARELGAKSKSSLAFLFGSPSPAPAESFRENPPASSSCTMSGIHDEPPPHVSSSSLVAACGRDLGGVLGDRRLHGVRVVRRVGGDEESWVVRCVGHALEEEQHQYHVLHEKKIADDDAKTSDGPCQVGKSEEDGRHDKIAVDAKLSDAHQVDFGWGSDTSSDLFELDLQDMNNH